MAWAVPCPVPAVCPCSSDNAKKAFIGNLNKGITKDALQAVFGASVVDVDFARSGRCAIAAVCP